MLIGPQDWSPAEYHRDPCDEPSLSSSIAHTLVSKSPAHARLRHPRFGAERGERTDATTDGSLFHALVLGVGMEEIAIIDADNFRTKVAQAARDEAEAAGKTPVLARKRDAMQWVADNARARLRDRHGIDVDASGKGASAEQAIAWGEGAVQCRALLDLWTGSEVIDLKSCDSAHPRAIQSHMVSYGYDIQAEAYTRGAQAAFKLDRRPPMRFAFCELVAPFAITVVRLAPSMEELGGLRWARALELWAACVRSGVWPEYVDGEAVIEAPAWALQSAMESEGT